MLLHREHNEQHLPLQRQRSDGLERFDRSSCQKSFVIPLRTSQRERRSGSPHVSTLACAGELPLLEQPLLPFKGPFQKNPEGLAIVRFEFDISTAGEIDLAMSLTDGVTMWLDGDPIEPQSTRRLNPKTGRHQVTLAVNTTKVKDTKAIIIHLNDVPGSTAQVQLVSGK